MSQFIESVRGVGGLHLGLGIIIGAVSNYILMTAPRTPETLPLLALIGILSLILLLMLLYGVLKRLVDPSQQRRAL